MSRSKEAQEIADQMYDSFRDELRKRELSNTENYDKTVLTLSSASLAFSVAILNGLPTKDYFGILAIAWVLLVAVIISTLSAYLVGNKALADEQEKARRYYKESDESAFDESSCADKLNKWLNRFSGFGVCLSITLLVAFTALNFKEDKDMSSKNKTAEKMINQNEGGLVPNSANIPRMERVPESKPAPSESNSNGSSKKI